MNKLIWFRQDLRVNDNVALTLACQSARTEEGKLYGLYIASPAQWLQHDVAPIQIDFIERQLHALSAELGKLNIPLYLLHVDNYQSIPPLLSSVCTELAIDKVYASSDIEWNEIQRDHSVHSSLLQKGVAFHCVEQDCILPCKSVLTGAGEMYRVFTPFSRRWREIACELSHVCLPVPEPVPTAMPNPTPFESLSIDNAFKGSMELSLQLTIDSDKRDSRAWSVGESGAYRHLQSFIRDKVHDYEALRDFPAKLATSGLSPYLALGIISPRQCLAVLMSEYPEVLVEESSDGRVWLNELIWREFYRHLLVAYPRLSRGHNFNPKFDKVIWRNNFDEFDAWCAGKTGYPMIDAAMRQLNQTGWMHNRLRMLVASFLTKHLLIDWRWGESYFKRHLIDGDLAANNGGWQWSAGCGCDAQPYFRIFNPITQAKKFDPDGVFIKHFVPELEHERGKDLVEAKEIERYNGALNLSYPKAIVEHGFARKRALEAFTVMKDVDVN